MNTTKDQRPVNLHKRVDFIVDEAIRQLNEVLSNVVLLHKEGIDTNELGNVRFYAERTIDQLRCKKGIHGKRA